MTRSRTTNSAATMAAVLVAGLGASMALGAGAATAANKADEAGAAGKAKGDVFVSSTAGSLADSARHQADQQHKAADAAKQAKKRAAEKAARDAKKRAARLGQARLGQVRAERRLRQGRRPLVAQPLRPGLRGADRHPGEGRAQRHRRQGGPNGAGDGPAYGNADRDQAQQRRRTRSTPTCRRSTCRPASR